MNLNLHSKRMNNILDTRNLQTRLNDLEDLRDTLEQNRQDRKDLGGLPNSTKKELDDVDNTIRLAEMDFGTDEIKELKELENLKEEVSEWNNGNTLILESYFVEYCEELLRDCGDLPKEIPWYIEINWTKTSENLKSDYSECEYGGEIYYYRNC